MVLCQNNEGELFIYSYFTFKISYISCLAQGVIWAVIVASGKAGGDVKLYSISLPFIAMQMQSLEGHHVNPCKHRGHAVLCDELCFH